MIKPRFNCVDKPRDASSREPSSEQLALQNPIPEIINDQIQIYFQCNVCLTAKSIKQFKSINSSCVHQFCLPCLQYYIEAKISQNQTKIKCPEQKCQQQMSQFSQVFKCLPQNLKQKYLKFLINRMILENPNLKHCPNINCEQVLYVHPPDPFTCQICKVTFCSICLQIDHQGKCARSNEQLKTLYGYKECPECHLVVEKTTGCNHMSCVCGFEFCYICGNKFQRGGGCHIETRRNYVINNCGRCCRIAILACAIPAFTLFFFIYFPFIYVAYLCFCVFYQVPQFVYSFCRQEVSRSLSVLIVIALILCLAVPLAAILYSQLQILYWMYQYWRATSSVFSRICSSQFGCGIARWWEKVRWIKKLCGFRY